MNGKDLPLGIASLDHQKIPMHTLLRWKVIAQGISTHSVRCHGWQHWQRTLFWVTEVCWWRTGPLGRAGAWTVALVGASPEGGSGSPDPSVAITIADLLASRHYLKHWCVLKSFHLHNSPLWVSTIIIPVLPIWKQEVGNLPAVSKWRSWAQGLAAKFTLLPTTVHASQRDRELEEERGGGRKAK